MNTALWIIVTVVGWTLIVCMSTAVSAVFREFLLRGVDWLSRRVIDCWVGKLQEASRAEMRETWRGELEAALEKDLHFSGMIFAVGIGVGIHQMRQLGPRPARATRRGKATAAIKRLFKSQRAPAILGGLVTAGPFLTVQLVWPAWSIWLAIGFGTFAFVTVIVRLLVHRRTLGRQIDR